MTTVEKATRKPGRPRKYEGGRHNATVRFTPTRYDALKSQAEENRRSISEEVEARVERSFTDDKLTEIGRGVREISDEIADMQTEMIQRQTAHIQQLAARVQELEARNALDEEAIERAVDRAIARAFARMGEVK